MKTKASCKKQEVFLCADFAELYSSLQEYVHKNY